MARITAGASPLHGLGARSAQSTSSFSAPPPPSTVTIDPVNILQTSHRWQKYADVCELHGHMGPVTGQTYDARYAFDRCRHELHVRSPWRRPSLCEWPWFSAKFVRHPHPRGDILQLPWGGRALLQHADRTGRSMQSVTYTAHAPAATLCTMASSSTWARRKTS